ncbi:hypothetical protein L0337_43400 [candidate division KSB1 bacterium]|nr:hypothetical protein [candidate division KSB1 bacterium]
MKKEYGIYWSFLVLRLSLVLLTVTAGTTVSQDYPPAQGPPLQVLPSPFVPMRLLINIMNDSIQVAVDTVNARISRQANSTHVRAHLSFTYTTHKPYMTTTQHLDRPNENILRIAFSIIYYVTDIRFYGVPYFSRQLGQSIDLLVSCNNWFTNQGRLRITIQADRPNLKGESLPEEALNFFMANTLSNLVDNELRKILPNAFTAFFDLPESGALFDPACNSLGAYPGTGPDYTDGSINYRKTNIPLPPISTIYDASVTFQSIKRLPARTLSLDVLYNEVEDIQLVLYANQTIRTAQLLGMREGDERNLIMETAGLGRLGDNASVVLICNVEQLASPHKDTRFRVFTKENNFGNGIQKIIVQKTYWESPRPLPNGRVGKPTEIKVDAYEIIARINVPIDVIEH